MKLRGGSNESIVWYATTIILLLSVIVAPTSASNDLLSTKASTGVSVKSTPSATQPKSPYELLPLVPLILPPFSAR